MKTRMSSHAVSFPNSRLIVLTLMLAVAPRASLAQGTFAAVRLNTYDSGRGIFEQPGGSARAGTLVQLLAGPNQNSLQPVKSEDPRFGTVLTIEPAGVNALG